MQEMNFLTARIADAPRFGVVGYAAWQRGIGVRVGPQAHARISPEMFASFARASYEQIIVAESKGAIAEITRSGGIRRELSDTRTCYLGCENCFLRFSRD